MILKNLFKKTKLTNMPLVQQNEIGTISPEEFADRLLEKYAQDKYKPSNRKKDNFIK